VHGEYVLYSQPAFFLLHGQNSGDEAGIAWRTGLLANRYVGTLYFWRFFFNILCNTKHHYERSEKLTCSAVRRTSADSHLSQKDNKDGGIVNPCRCV
jgi:hypothetical protein